MVCPPNAATLNALRKEMMQAYAEKQTTAAKTEMKMEFFVGNSMV